MARTSSGFSKSLILHSQLIALCVVVIFSGSAAARSGFLNQEPLWDASGALLTEDTREYGESERRSLATSSLPPFDMFDDTGGILDAPDDGPLKRGNSAEHRKGIHFTVDALKQWHANHGNPNWAPNEYPAAGSANANANSNALGTGTGASNAQKPCTGKGCPPPSTNPPPPTSVPVSTFTPSNNVPLTYHGGPTMFATQQFPKLTVYVIYYGPANSWTDANALNVVHTLLNNIGGSPYFQINQGNMGAASPAAGYYYQYSTYNGNQKEYPPNVAGNPGFGGFMYDSTYTSAAGTLTQTSIQNIVANAVSKNASGIAVSPMSSGSPAQYDYQSLPVNGSAVYFVATALSVPVSGLCTQFCGYHSYFSQNVASGTYAPSVYLKFALVGDVSNCVSSCATVNRQVSPNGMPGIDAMMSVIAHELEEAVTDVSGSAWYDSLGNENGDKCAYDYGPLSQTSLGAYYNLQFGGLNYLIQMNYVNLASNGYCAMAYDYNPSEPVYP